MWSIFFYILNKGPAQVIDIALTGPSVFECADLERCEALEQLAFKLDHLTFCHAQLFGYPLFFIISKSTPIFALA